MHPGRRWTVALTVTLGAAAAQPSPAQPPTRRAQSSADSARFAADLFFRAVADERWDVAAAMTDTLVIRRMVAERLRWRREAAPRPDLGIDDFMRDDPSKPRVVAEYELKRYRERVAQFEADPISFEFTGVKSLDELALLGARDATARYLQAQDYRVQSGEIARRSGCPLFKLPFLPHRILGAVLASDTVAYVLHTDDLLRDNGPVSVGPMVMELRLRNTRWLVRPNTEVLQRANTAIGATSCDTTRKPPG